MKQILIKNGEAMVEEVPAPEAGPGEVLVGVAASCISVGTELSGLQTSDMPLWKRAVRNPDKVVKALRMMAEKGVGRTMGLVQGQLSAGLAVGYSVAGRVIGLGDGIHDISLGDRVACAGAGYAMHAEIVRVPRNLAVAIPDGVEIADAATVTLGAIALQGVRRLQPTLGETVVVVGLGVLGQIAVQLLKSNGCHVIGMDLDARRVELARTLGCDLGLLAGEDLPARRIARLTGGVGADGVIVTAAARDETLLNTAFAMCRRKGRVVLVGDVPITIDRAAIYRNELDFLISTSYGPGRYDHNYEENGLDYPVGYVRWTENRNMDAYLDLIAAGRVKTDGLIEAKYPVEQAATAYAALSRAEGPRPLAVLLQYGVPAEAAPARRIATRSPKPTADGAIGVGLVGTSGFAQATHLPNMADMAGGFALRAVWSKTGHHAKHVAETNGAAYATTDLAELLGDPKIDLVMITGRHDEHGGQVLAALEAGKHVFVEKPLALNETELAAIEAFYSAEPDPAPVLMTGFNRRFSPAARAISGHLAGRDGPMVITYRMNAGFIPQSHWTQRPEGGGRNIGEACHIYDLFTAFTGARVVQVAVAGIGREDEHMRRNENFSVALTFDDGSLATLAYTSLGGAPWPKEQMEIFCDGRVLALDDYRSAHLSGARGGLWEGVQDKGHKGELETLLASLKGGGDWPISLWEQLQATRISFDVEHGLYARSSLNQP